MIGLFDAIARPMLRMLDPEDAHRLAIHALRFPPLVKLVAALPVLPGAGAATRHLYASRYWREEPPNKAGLAHEFTVLTADRYFELVDRRRPEVVR